MNGGTLARAAKWGAFLLGCYVFDRIVIALYWAVWTVAR